MQARLLLNDRHLARDAGGSSTKAGAKRLLAANERLAAEGPEAEKGCS